MPAGLRMFTLARMVAGLWTVTYHNGAHVWDVVSGKEVFAPLELEAGSWGRLALFSPDGRYILIAAGSSAQLWHADTGKPASPPLVHPHVVEFAEFDADSRRFVVTTGGGGGYEGQALVYDVTTAKLLLPPLRHPRPVNHAAFGPDGRYLVTASGFPDANELRAYARLWDSWPRRGPMQPPLKEYGVTNSSMSYSPDGPIRLACPGGHGLDCLGRCHGCAPPGGSNGLEKDVIGRLVQSADGKRFCVQRMDGSARVWDMATLRPAGPVVASERQKVSAKDRAAQRYNPIFRIRPGPLSERAQRLLQDSDVLGGRAVLSPNGQHLLTAILTKSKAFDPCIIQVWDVASGQLLGPSIRTGDFYSLAFSPDSRQVLVGGNKAQVWDVATGKAVGAAMSQRTRAVVYFVAYSPDGRRLATASFDQAARIWDAATGKPVLPDLEHGGGVNQVAFGGTGRLLVTASQDKTGARYGTRPQAARSRRP